MKAKEKRKILAIAAKVRAKTKTVAWRTYDRTIAPAVRARKQALRTYIKTIAPAKKRLDKDLINAEKTYNEAEREAEVRDDKRFDGLW